MTAQLEKAADKSPDRSALVTETVL